MPPELPYLRREKTDANLIWNLNTLATGCSYLKGLRKAVMLSELVANWPTAVLALLTGAIIALFSLWLHSAYQRRHERLRDTRNRPALRVEVLGREIIPEAGFHEVVFVFGDSLTSKRDKAFCILSFVISNHGEATAKDVRLQVHWPALLMQWIDLLEREPVGNDSIVTKYSREVDTSHPKSTTITYAFGAINPGVTAEILEHAEVSSASGVKTRISGQFAGGEAYETDLEIKWRLNPIHLVLTATDYPRLHSSFTIESVRGKSMDDVAADMQAVSEQTFGKLRGTRLRPKVITSLLVDPHLEEVPKPATVQDDLDWRVLWQKKEGTQGALIGRIEAEDADEGLEEPVV